MELNQLKKSRSCTYDFSTGSIVTVLRRKYRSQCLFREISLTPMTVQNDEVELKVICHWCDLDLRFVIDMNVKTNMVNNYNN